MNFVPAISRVTDTVAPIISNLLSPAKLGWAATRFPSGLNCLVVQQSINTLFSEQIADGDFEFLQDRTLQIEILDAQLFIGLGYQQDKIKCLHFDSQPLKADASLSIKTHHAIKLIQQEIDPDTLFFQRKLKISGDTELAHNVKNTIDTLDPEVMPTLIMKLISEYEQRVLNDK